MSGEATEQFDDAAYPCNQRRLSGRILPRPSIGDFVQNEMFLLFERYYLNATPAQFRADLLEKSYVMLLRDIDGMLVGFSTLDEQLTVSGGERIRVFFSGDTIIAPAFWGSSEMPRLWTRFMFRRAAEDPERRSFWFLISSGYKTYRLLPVFFQTFYPQRTGAARSSLSALLNELAHLRFGEQFLAERGVVRLKHPTPLRPGVAEIADSRSKDPDVQFFVERNPLHHTGEELACLAELRLDNLTAAGERMLGQPRPKSKRRA